MKKFKNNIFLKLFFSFIAFILTSVFVLIILAYEQQSLFGFSAFLKNHFLPLFDQPGFLSVAISLIALAALFSYLLTRKISYHLFYLKNQAQAIFEGRYLFNNQQGGNPRNDEFGELAFWLDKISLSVKNQKELLMHEAEVLTRRDWRLVEASAELKLERDKIRAIVENLAEGIVMLDDQGVVSLVNPWAEIILGVKKEALLGQPLTQTSLSKDILSLYKEIKKRPLNRPLKREVSLRDDGQEERFFVANLIPLNPKDHLPSSYVLSLYDVTREKLINQMKSEFISIAAHQLRTPLSAIKWIFHMLISEDLGPVNSAQKSFLQKGYDSNERMIVLINDLLNVTKIEEGRFLFDFEKVSLKDLLEQILGESIAVAAKNGVALEFNAPKIMLPTILADAQKMKIAFQNLIDNAIKYSFPQGKVIVTLKKELDRYLINISDQGVGVPQDQKQRIFNKFFRGSNVVKMETDGTGLGLFITKNIIEKHGGSISFTSEENKGTTFTIELPLNSVTTLKDASHSLLKARQ